MKTSIIQRQTKEYLNYCEFVRNMSPQTIRSKKWLLLRHFSQECCVSDLQELDNSHINKWIAKQIARGVSGRTVNGRLSHIKAMIKYHRDMGLKISVKLPLIVKVKELPPRQVFFTRAQIHKALKYANDLEWLLIRICFDTGMRLGELTYLKLENVSGCELRYIGKGRKARRSFICQDTRDRLEAYCIKYEIQDYLWKSPMRWDGLPYSLEEIRRLMKRPFEYAGLKGFYPHALRHSFGTDIQRNGASIPEAQKLLGHSKYETTERYLHNLDNRLGELFAKYKKAVV